MFDVTLTDIEFKKDFVHQDSDWMASASLKEPDLRVDGLRESPISRFVSLLSGSRDATG